VAVVGAAIDVDEMPAQSTVPVHLLAAAQSKLAVEVHLNGTNGTNGTNGIGSIADSGLQAILDAKARGYEGDSCVECGAMTMVRNGACLKCVSCGSTSGCS
jgi:ribonucleoside-diphosphate reductase alpha chain